MVTNKEKLVDMSVKINLFREFELESIALNTSRS